MIQQLCSPIQMYFAIQIHIVRSNLYPTKVNWALTKIIHLIKSSLKIFEASSLGLEVRSAPIWMMAILSLSGILGSTLARSEEGHQTNQILADAAKKSEEAKSQKELEWAYQKEFAFLETERLQLQASLNQLKNSFQAQVEQEHAHLKTLEAQKSEVSQRLTSYQDQLQKLEQSVTTPDDRTNLIAGTLLQMNQTLMPLTVTKVDDEAAATSNRDEQQLLAIEQGLSLAQNSLNQGANIYTRTENYYLADGRETSGTIIHLGQVAAFAESSTPEETGLLVPAGQGQLRIQNRKSQASKALGFNQQLSQTTIHAFLFENLAKEYTPPREKQLKDTLMAGGLIGWVILTLGAVSFVLIILRTLLLRQAANRIDQISKVVEEKVTHGDIKGALKVCQEQKSPIGRIMALSLEHIDSERERFEDLVSERILKESMTLDRFATIIIVTAAIAPLLGLLGTVTGMISTFDMITTFGTGDPKMLSGGISEALITTMFGLIVAIPTLFFGNILNHLADKLKDHMEKAALHIVNHYGYFVESRQNSNQGA